MADTVIITGATSGIGLALTKNYIEKGTKVYAIGRDSDKFRLVIKEWCQARGWESLCEWIHSDFSVQNPLVNIDFTKFPKVDGFINCAGVLPIAPLKLETEEEIHIATNINFLSPILFTRSLLKYNCIHKGGSIVFLGSINGTKVGSKGHTIYSATKGGITGFMMSLANELSSLGIRVNVISPGTVETPMAKKVESLIGTKGMKNYLDQYPLGAGTPQSLIPLINLLIDKKSASWITGQNFIVDGGYTVN